MTIHLGPPPDPKEEQRRYRREATSRAYKALFRAKREQMAAEMQK
ncbi:hypothetical protein ACSMXM_05580 [Pacificimonas sp. ICDLI1SI03]